MKNDTQRREIERLKARNQFLEEFYRKYSETKLKFRERVKELKCIYQIAQSIVEDKEIGSALSEIIDTIPQGWQYPVLTCARLKIENLEFSTPNLMETPWVLSKDIIVDTQTIGKLEVFYLKNPVGDNSDPFLEEERELLSGIASIIGGLVKQHRINENKNLIKQQLLHADRLATIGQLAAGVAHELNEPLTNILGFAQLMTKNDDIGETSLKDLRKIEDASLYARRIIKQLMEFSRQTVPTIKSFDLGEVVLDAISFFDSRIKKEGVDLKVNIEEEIVIQADPDQIKQVVTNLGINAIQAMKGGGELTIEVSCLDGNACLSVTDTGVGISSENVDKIFMPFFTTKGVGEGTGLGLAVVYGIIKGFSGDIKVSSLDSGTRFDITIPIKSDEFK